MPSVPVSEWTRVVLKKGMVQWRDDRGKSVMWVQENEYEAFRQSLERYIEEHH